MLNPEHQFLLPAVTVLHSRLQSAFSRVVGMHLSRFRLLFLLHVLGESSPGALLKKGSADAAALTRIMNDFEAEGLVVRRPDPADARARLVSLTEAGQARVQALLPIRDAFVAEALDGLSAEENALLASLLTRIEANISALAGLPAVGDSFNIDPARPEE